MDSALTAAAAAEAAALSAEFVPEDFLLFPSPLAVLVASAFWCRKRSGRVHVLVVARETGRVHCSRGPRMRARRGGWQRTKGGLAEKEVA